MISRLTNEKVTVLKETAFLSKALKTKLDSAINKSGVNFLLKDAIEIHAAFTTEGIKMFRTKLDSRPILSNPKELFTMEPDRDYCFICTPYQAKKYFLDFGANVRISAPEALAAEFKRFYKKAFDSYDQALR